MDKVVFYLCFIFSLFVVSITNAANSDPNGKVANTQPKGRQQAAPYTTTQNQPGSNSKPATHSPQAASSASLLLGSNRNAANNLAKPPLTGTQPKSSNVSKRVENTTRSQDVSKVDGSSFKAEQTNLKICLEQLAFLEHAAVSNTSPKETASQDSQTGSPLPKNVLSECPLQAGNTATVNSSRSSENNFAIPDGWFVNILYWFRAVAIVSIIKFVFKGAKEAYKHVKFLLFRFWPGPTVKFCKFIHGAPVRADTPLNTIEEP